MAYNPGDNMDLLCLETKEVVWSPELGPAGSISRYKTEFKEVGFLGEGGYGSVLSGESKLDKQKYAIKKIMLENLEGE